MLQSATEFSKAGFTPEESAQLAQVASLYQNIADAEISAGEAASFITSQIKAFKDYGVEANNATQIIDKLNEVSNNYSVSSTDIASALTKQSASLAAYGNNLNESIALVTAGTEIMTGQAGKVARGLRTIGANITQLAQNAKEFDITVNGATKTIQLWNETGTDMLNTYDVLKQISAEWDNMTNAEKSSLAIDLAKKTQMDTFLAVLGNFEDAEKAYTTALLSEGSAWKENEKYMESIEAHQAKLKQQWEQLVLSAPIENLEKSLLDAGTAILKFANNDTVQLIAKLSALLTVVALATKAFAAFKTVVSGGSTFAVFINLLQQVIAGETTLTAVTSFLTTTLLANPLFWGATVVLGITAIIKAVDALIVTFDEATKTLRENNQAVEEQSSTVDSLESSLNNIREKIEEVNKSKLQITDKNQLDELEKESKELSRQEALIKSQLVLEQKKLEVLKQEALNSAEKVRDTTQSYNVYNVDNYGKEDALQVKKGGIIDALTAQMNNIDSLNEKISDYKSKLEELDKQEKSTSDEAIQYANIIQELEQLLIEEEKAANANAEALLNIEQADGKLTKAEQEVLDLYTSTEQAINNVGQASKTTQDDIDNMVESTDEQTNATEDAAKAWDEYIDNIEDIQSAYETLTKAVDEYNENGYITASTLKKLNKLNPEYLALLAQEGDAYTNITEGLNGYLDAEKKDALTKVELARQIAIVQACQDKLAESSNGAKDEIKKVGDTAEEVSPQMAELARKTTQAAIGMIAVKNAGKMDEDFKSQLDDINKYFDGLSANIEKVSLGSAKSSKSAASSSKDAWVEAFEEEQRQLKHSLEMNEITELEYYERLKDLNEKYFGEISGKHQKYIKEYQENEEEIYKGTKAVYDKVKDYLKEAVENGYEKAINALEKEEKKVLDEIKKQIDALKKEKSSVLDGIKDEIDALKRQKDAVQDYYNKQIDVIKKENDVLQEQNELLEYQQALQQAKAQKVMVMQDGKFQLGENESAVAQAEQNLSNYQDQLSYEQQIQQLEELRDAQVESIDERIASLEEYYDYMEDYYDKQIESMESYYDQVQEQYELQIEALQAELDAFKEGYQKSEDLENAKLAASVLAANEEAAVWQTRLENLANAVTEYNKLLSMIGEEGTVASSGFKFSEASYNPSSSVGGVDSNIQTRASGDASFKNDEIALVGESPNTELVLGSRLNKSVNSGVLTHLSKGSGVVNAESTQTLAGLLNGLANPTSISNARSTQQTFNFGAITLPNVTNAESFVGALRDKFNNYSIQYSTIKK